jgi:hypothetical protein
MPACNREPTGFPVQYLGANVPQAWAAGVTFMVLQAMLGLQPCAPGRKVYVDPALPDWLPDITLTNLRLGRRRFDIRFPSSLCRGVESRTRAVHGWQSCQFERFIKTCGEANSVYFI